jgi:hypothetical protein
VDLGLRRIDFVPVGVHQRNEGGGGRDGGDRGGAPARRGGKHRRTDNPTQSRSDGAGQSRPSADAAPAPASAKGRGDKAPTKHRKGRRRTRLIGRR